MQKKCVWVGAALLLATTLNAQQTKEAGDSIGTTLLNEVVITANKLAQKQSRTGKVITVINKGELQQNAARTVSQILNQTAGITINGAMNNLGTNPTVYTRGSSSGRTLILVDGMPVYDPSFIGNEFDLNFITPGTVERIEIARGAQSTLYGSDAIGGAINMLTRASNPEQEPFGGEVGLSYGSFNTLKPHANLFGKRGPWDYKLSYSGVFSDGFSSANDAAGSGNFDKDGIAQNGGNARIGYSFAEGLKASGFVNFSKYKADVDNGAFVDDRDFTNTTENLLTGAVLDWKKNTWTMRLQYMFGSTGRLQLNDSGHVSGFAKYASDDYEGESHYAEWYGLFNLGNHFKLLGGLDYRLASMNNQYFSLSSFGPYETQFNDTSVSLGSAYSSLIFEKNRINIEGGLRVNSHETFGTNTTFTFNPSYRLNEQWRVFGSVATGFKAPSLYQLYSSYGNKNLSPETSSNYEAGVAISQRNLGSRLVFFYRDIENTLDFDYINYVYFNGGNQKVTGIEWEGNFKFGEKFSFNANYTFMHANDRIQSRVTTKDTTYNYLLKRPDHKAYASFNYTPSKKISIGFNTLYVGVRKDVGGYQVPDVTLDSYMIWGLQLRYSPTERLVLYADGQNIFDKEFYDLNGFNSIGSNIQVGARIGF